MPQPKKRKPKGRSVPQPTGGEAGFTLIEVVVAVLILGLAYVAVLQNFSISLSNIFRLESSRSSTFEEYLAFEDQLAAGAEDQEFQEQPMPGEVYLEGRKYNVEVVTSDNNEFMSLRLVRP